MSDRAARKHVALHIRVSKPIYDKLLARLSAMRKKTPMANLSDAVREVIDRGLR